jgi:hypothetical protein
MIFRGAACLALFLVAGCATKLPSVPFDRAAGNVKTIAFVTPAIAAKPTLFSLAPVSPLGVFGVLGGLGDESIQKEHAEHFAEILASHGFSPRPILITGITQALKAKGFSVTLVDTDRPAPDFLAQYPSGASTGSDAYLDVVLVNYGYFGTTALAPYRPIVGMKFRLVRASDGKVLMLGHFGYSVMGSDTHPPEAYDYDHYDDFSSDQERSIKGIEDGLGKAAEAVGTALN